MAQAKILVTGASGFAGGQLCRRLSADGHGVRALVREPARCTALKSWGVELHRGDLRDRNSIKTAVQGVDLVYHIAASYRDSKASRKELWETNVTGTQNMLDAAKAADVARFVHCSTIGVHGCIENPPANEETPYAPGDDYQESKAAAERMVRNEMERGTLSIVIFRPAGIYGPGDLRFLKLFKAIKQRRFLMLGSGRITYHFVYIDDLIDGILLCGNQEKSVGRIYILGGESPITLNHLVALIAQVLGVSPPALRLPVAPFYFAGYICELVCKPLGLRPPLYRRRVDFFRKNRAFDISKARVELGYDPKVSMAAGIDLTAQWYQSSGLL